MPKSFIQKAFGPWLSLNRSRFRFQPVIVKRRKNFIRLRFAGVSQKIGCVITRHCADIYVSHKGECWDILTDFGVSEKKSPSGYYCGLCVPHERRYFATREELLTEHCFDGLLEWLNEELSERTWIYLFATEGVTWAEIKEKDDGMLENKNLVHAFPVVDKMRTEASDGSRIDKRSLKRMVTVKEAENSHMVFNEEWGMKGRTFGFRHKAWLNFKSKIMDGDELWEFDSMNNGIFPRIRNAGILLLRNDEIMATFMTIIS